MKNIKLLKTIAATLIVSSLGVITPNIANAEGQAYWQSNNNNWYYMNGSGNVTTGWVKDSGNWYYLGSDGVMKTGWIYDSGNWYYCWSNGQMATDTTIDGYYLNSSGAWTTSIGLTSNNSGGSFTWEDVDDKHTLRGDIGIAEEDRVAANQLTNNNINITDENKRDLAFLAENLGNGKIYISEVRNNCIGKTVNNKYKITDIKYFNQVFSTTTGSFTGDKIKAIKNSSLYKYNSSTPYKYDAYLVYSCGNARSNEWEATRVVVEFETI